MKYELTNRTLEFFLGDTVITLYQIRALRDIKPGQREEYNSDFKYLSIKAGDLGGYIQSTDNLSQDGECWVDGNAKVYENAKIVGNSLVSDQAEVFGKAFVCGTSCIKDEAKVYEFALVEGNTSIGGKVKIHGKAEISSSVIRGEAEILGDAKILNGACVQDNATVFEYGKAIGKVQICGSAKIFGRAVVADEALVGENAVISGTARICDTATVRGNASVADWTVSGRICLSQSAKIRCALNLISITPFGCFDNVTIFANEDNTIGINAGGHDYTPKTFLESKRYDWLLGKSYQYDKLLELAEDYIQFS